MSAILAVLQRCATSLGAAKARLEKGNKQTQAKAIHVVVCKEEAIHLNSQ
jgi:hypothetical protein